MQGIIWLKELILIPVERQLILLNNTLNPCIEIPTNYQASNDSTVSLPIHPCNLKSFDSKKRRRTIYEFRSYETNQVLQDCISETPTYNPPRHRDRRNLKIMCRKPIGDGSIKTFSLRDAPIDMPCTIHLEKLDRRCPKCFKSPKVDPDSPSQITNENHSCTIS